MKEMEVTWQVRDTAVEKPVKIPCIECGHQTKHRIATSFDCHGSNEYVEYWTSYQVAQCMGCEAITFLTLSSHSEDWDENSKGEIYLPVSVVYFPRRSAGRTELEDFHLLPAQLQRIYGETLNALNNDQLILSGIGIRALIEMICKEKSASGSNLQQKIDWLVAKNILTENDARILHMIRTLGNSAAHEAIPHDSGQLSLALDICEHLLKGVYLIPMYVKRKL